MKVGDFVKPICPELKFVLDKQFYLVEKVKVFGDNSNMIKLFKQPLYFNSKDFILCEKSADNLTSDDNNK